MRRRRRIAKSGNGQQGIHVEVREVVQRCCAALQHLVFSEIRCPVHLDICVASNLVNMLSERQRGCSVLVEDVVVTRAVEEMDDGAPGIRRHSIFFILEHVAIYL